MVDIAARRIENQRISGSEFRTAGEVVRWLGAVQAQDYASAEWSVGLRLPGATQATVDQALDDGSVVRTWMLRGTLHFVAGEDFGWMLRLLAPKVIAGNARRYRELELDDATMMRANALLVDSFQQSAFSDQPVLTRSDLLAMLEKNGIVTKGQRGIYLLQRAALDGLLCRGVTRGGDDIYMALKAIPAKLLTREEALVELARRYFTSHGPATFQDFVGWTGLKTGDAREGFEAVKSEFVAETVEGQVYWMAESAEKAHDSTYLLPGFDEYILGYKDRSAVLDGEFSDLICPGGNGVFYPTIVHRGRVVGTWKRAFKKGKVIMTPARFSDHEIGDFEAAAAKFAAFVGMEVGE